MNEVADYIIVGAGSAGCIAANRISADPSVTVQLLEAGSKDTNPWIHVPVGYFRTMHDPKYDWCYATEPDPGLNGRVLNWPRGKVLGGSSSLNGLLYVRGQQQDYDHWAQLGNHGWSWQDVGPIFESFETFHRPGAVGRGQQGELQVSDPRLKRAICEKWLEAAQANGYPYNADYNGPTQEGVGHFQLTMHNGRRCSSAKAFLAPVRHRQNLIVQTDCQITRVLIKAGRACGVEVRRRDGTIDTIDANREVILCAGAIGSPHILLMSGIGPAQHLKDHGIVVHRDAPEVGQNLQDHLQARMVYKCNEPTLNDEVRSLFKKAAIGLQYALFRTGPMTMAASLVFGFVKTRPELATPDVQFHIQPWSADSPGEGVHPFSAFTQSVCQLRPQSRGTIALQSANAFDYPLIRPNYLATRHDQQTLVDGIRIARRIARTQPLLSAIAEEYRPTADLQSDDELLGWARDNSTTIYHPTGTCRMGADQNAVVDPCLRVRGVAGLRVADCSIMPEIVSGNTNAPAMMIGAKIAEMVLKDKRAASTMQMAARTSSYEKVA
ncbi:MULTISPECIES: GMC family oxidoreductase [Ochrobactrum]|uniref:Choline dehydrogenase n=1 Tax=Ochrobactrum quorumnocens TaxID=271865 RepID=A0A5N1JVQ5_9HYPH|nr:MULTISPECIES: GMC family oxidoreductase N-terminal domain-containing protein [Brucella/Ochrobactrum group]KAA9367298.1 choline dehydrogenase [[Ochrobactrum] quorumnocens]MBD7992075.1 GMC family oxidoreductase N-terminal domain-containing protein [Ochrobactrum gallinarum]MDH7793342.1 choline dehydrogenase [Ochrobactrum sp. AN78]